MRAIALITALAGVVSEARADSSFSLEPVPAQEGQVVTLRVDDSTGCTPFGAPTIIRDGNVVTASFLQDDAQQPPPCMPQRVAPRTHSLGPFMAGSYTVRVEYCGALPPPNQCSVVFALPLTVFGNTGARFTVPAMSGAVAIAFTFLLMVIGALSSRRGT